MAVAGYTSARLTAAVPGPGSDAATAAKAAGAVGAGQVLALDLGSDGSSGSGGGSGRRSGRQPQALLYLPAGYRPGVPAPFVLTLHGAGGDAFGGLNRLLAAADAHGALLLAPESAGGTWDMLRGGFGPDVELIDRALATAFQQYAVDSGRVCASGFSDGASYALSLGAANGQLFTHVAAFSPGFMRPPVTVGKPLIYISHGANDRVLRIDYCSRRIVPSLQAQGYLATYREFDGGHNVPPEYADEALTWLAGSKGQPAAGREG